MKKILAALIMLALLLLNLPKSPEMIVDNEGAAVTFHFDREVAGAEFKGSTYRLEGGNGGFAGLVGTEVSFNGDLSDVDALLARLSAVRLVHEEVDGAVVYTGYSALLKGGIRAKGRIVNFQIAFAAGVVTVGSPLIFGSY